MYKLRGKVISKRTEDIKTSKGDFKKLLFIINKTNRDFDNQYQFEIFGEEKIVMMKDSIIEDRFINIDFYIKSNEWKDKYFYTLVPTHIHLEDESVAPDEVYDDENELDF